IMDGKVQGSATADPNGHWSFTPATDLSEGVHNFRAEVTDAAGNKTATGNFQLELDLTKPDAADDLTAEDNVGPITGPIQSGDTTDDSTPPFGGTGEPGDKVIVKDGDDVIGTTIVGEDGSWEFTPVPPLQDGEHSIIVIIEDPAGNQSDESAPIEFIVDTGNVA
ncbi:Ig-like domain-containing protein, partial [Pantoea sp. GbtcB22]|uniref:Ig-like domain-containing protein n=1 Tax=Pantoea sp. GbtcB22 TaxID=2824767 RepID=UPI001C30A28A